MNSEMFSWNDTSAETPSRSSGWTAVGLKSVLAIVLLSGCSRIELPHEESRLAIDALYTAVTSRRADLVDSCERQIHELESVGKLPSATARDLERIIAQARSQQWQPAAEKLDTLIRKIKD